MYLYTRVSISPTMKTIKNKKYKYVTESTTTSVNTMEELKQRINLLKESLEITNQSGLILSKNLDF